MTPLLAVGWLPLARAGRGLCLLLALGLAGVASRARAAEATDASPIVSSVQFEGAEYFKPETLRRMIRLREGQPLDEAQLQRDAKEIARQYRDRGFLSVQARGEWHLSTGQAVVVYRVQTGTRAKVRRVLVHGNQTLTDAEVATNLFTKPDEIFGAFKQAGVFHAGRLEQDLSQVARNFYQQGYLEAKVTGYKAFATPDHQAIDVTLLVTEGPLYRVGSVRFVGELPAPLEELQQDFALKPGDVANLVKVSEELDRLLDRWRDRGYPFPTSLQRSQVDPGERLLHVEAELQKNSFARIGTIQVRGEPWTASRVIEREFELHQGDAYSLAALKKSRDNLMATGLFMDAKLEPRAGSDASIVDVSVDLTERPGIIKDCIFNIAPAYLQYEGLIGIGLLMCPNFLGQGQRFTAIGQLSSLRQLFDVSWVEPRVLDSRFSLVTGVHRRRLIYPLFASNLLGAELGLTVPLPWDLSTSLQLGVDRVDVEPAAGLEAFADTARFPSGALRTGVTLRLAHDTRRGGVFPTSGMYHALSASTGGWWTLGQINFVELRATARYYLPLVLSALFKINLEAATVVDPTGQPVVVSERYFLGGFGSVRGYLPRSLGPTRRFGDAGDPAGGVLSLATGGTSQVVVNLELEAPLIKEIDLKGFLFLDAGNAFDETENFLLWGRWQDSREVPLPLGMYSSLGVGLLLPTGTLPIRLEWSMPLTRRPGDRDVDFFFGVGGMF
ncbi:MAG: outer membrane protein assembly factor BamA [Pseudomonadota bacterium]